MSWVQIPNLTPAIGLDGGELLEIVQAGTSRRATASQIAALVPGASSVQALTPEQFGAIGDGVTNDTTAFAAMFTYSYITGKNYIWLANKYLIGNVTITLENTFIAGTCGFGELNVLSAFGTVTSPYTLRGQLRQIATTTLRVAPGTAFRNVAFVRNGLASIPATTPAGSLAIYNSYGDVAITANSASTDIEQCAFYGYNYPVYLVNNAGSSLLCRLVFRQNFVDCYNGPYVSSTGEPDSIEDTYMYPSLTVDVRQTVTMSLTSPGVVTQTAHGYADKQRVFFRTTGTLPTGVVADTVYYARVINANTYNLSATDSGPLINFTVGQSGTHACSVAESRERPGNAIFLSNRDTRSRIVDNDCFGYALGFQIGESGGNYASGVDVFDNNIEMPPTTINTQGISAVCEYFSGSRNTLIGQRRPVYVDALASSGNDTIELVENDVTPSGIATYAFHIERGYPIAIGNMVQGSGTQTAFETGAGYVGGIFNANRPYNCAIDYDILTAAKASTRINGWSPWITYSPTITAETGTPTTVSTSMQYRIGSETVQTEGSVTCTAKGTAVGALFYTTPGGYNPTRNGNVGTGSIQLLSGDMLQLYSDTSGKIGVRRYDWSDPWANGARYEVQASYYVQNVW